MAIRMAALLAVGILSLPGCSKTPPNLSGTGELKINDKVWSTYAWSNNRLSYVIYFTPPPGFNPDGAAAKLKSSSAKEGDLFEGSLDGSPSGKFPYKCEARQGNVTIEGRAFKTGNGNAFLVTPGASAKIQQLQVGFISGPKDTAETPGFMEAEIKKLAKENPKIKEFPNPPAPPTKKK